MSETIAGWGAPVTSVNCPVCDWSFLITGSIQEKETRCPHCFKGDLAELDAKLPYGSPEFVITPTVTTDLISKGIETFADKIPYPPSDLQAGTLQQRLKLMFLPIWLVDCSLSAMWEAESGFDYTVVSHREHFANGSWVTQKVEETRIRWEPRVGQLQRTYHNVSAPALQGHTELFRHLGSYNREKAQAYTPEKLIGAWVRLPDTPPESSWSDVVPSLQKHAAAEVQRADSADHIRKFRWAPEFQEKNWTLLLAPVYATYYTDDDGQSQPLLIHAQTGHIHGIKRSSMKNAQRLSLILALIAFVGFVLSLLAGVVGVVFPPLLIIAVVGGIITAGLGIGAFYPMIRSWRFNLQNEKK